MTVVNYCGECSSKIAVANRYCGQCGSPRPVLESVADSEGPIVGVGIPNEAAAGSTASDASAGGGPAVDPAVDDRTTLSDRRIDLPPVIGGTLDVVLWDGRRVPTNSRVLFGRDPSASAAGDLLIRTPDWDLSVSKTHAAIERDSERLWLVDMHSRNGVEIEHGGGERETVEPGQRVGLAIGDRILLGDLAAGVVARPMETAEATGVDRPREGVRSAGSTAKPVLSDPVEPHAHRVPDAAGPLIDSVPVPVVADSRPVPPSGVGLAAAPSEAPNSHVPPVPALDSDSPESHACEADSADPERINASGDGPQQSLPSAPNHAQLRSLSLALFAAAGLGALGLVMLLESASGLGLRDLLGWSSPLILAASCVMAVVAGLSTRRGSVSHSAAGTAAAGVIAAQSLRLMEGLWIPGWVFWVTLSLAMIAMLLLLSATARSGCLGDRQDGAAAGIILVLAVVAAISAVSVLSSYYRDGLSAFLYAAVAGLAAWALWSLRSGRDGWVVLAVVGLPMAAAVGNWTDSLSELVGSLCLLAALAMLLTPELRRGTPWANLGAASDDGTPALGASQGTGPISIAWADLRAWTRSSLPSMVVVGGLYWLVLGVSLVAALALLLVPVSLLGAMSWEPSDGQAAFALLFLLVGWQVGVTVVGQVLGLLSSQALAEAVSEHEGPGRVSGTWLAHRALAVLGGQLGTAVLYSLGVAAASFLCVLPGAYLQVRWAFALPMGVRSQNSGSEALRASWNLTQNRFWLTVGANMVGFGVTFAAAAVGVVLALVIQLIFGSTLIGGTVAVLVVAFGVTCSAVVIGSVLRQFLSADFGQSPSPERARPW